MYMYMTCKVYTEKTFTLRKRFHNYNRSTLSSDELSTMAWPSSLDDNSWNIFYCRSNLIALACGSIVNINRNSHPSPANCAWASATSQYSGTKVTNESIRMTLVPESNRLDRSGYLNCVYGCNNNNPFVLSGW